MIHATGERIEVKAIAAANMSSSSSLLTGFDLERSFWDKYREPFGSHVESPTIAGEGHEEVKMPVSSSLAGGVAICSGVTGDPRPVESANKP